MILVFSLFLCAMKILCGLHTDFCALTEWRLWKDEEKPVSLRKSKANNVTWMSYAIDLKPKITDKQEHLSSQAVSSRLSKCFQTLRPPLISFWKSLQPFFLEIVWDLQPWRKSTSVVKSGRLSSVGKTKSFKEETKKACSIQYGVVADRHCSKTVILKYIVIRKGLTLA